ncbi:MAG TPA: hypothetical protein VFV22_01265 [Candidatus Paceibacterota bacterium]|nr:hypothetical protein [Candidatus Paceibacterota bacterium]
MKHTHTMIHTYVTLMIVIFAGMFLLLPTNTHAYFTTNQKAISLNSHTGLFLIEYAFGTKKYDITMPVQATTSSIKDDTVLGYEIRDTHGDVVHGKTQAIILSNATLGRDGMYHIQKGTAQKMLLAVFFTPDTPQRDAYNLQVTHLPFQFDETQKLQLNPSELIYYKTPATEL